VNNPATTQDKLRDARQKRQESERYSRVLQMAAQLQKSLGLKRTEALQLAEQRAPRA
jgi:hypothetical protein